MEDFAQGSSVETPQTRLRDRRRHEETTLLSLRDLCFIGRPRDCLVAKVHAAQVKETAGVIPLAALVNCVSTSLVALGLRHVVPHAELMAWVAATVALALIRIAMARGFQEKESSAFYLVLGSLLAALLWVIPILFWFSLFAPVDWILVPIALAGMMSGGSVILANLPPAALTYLGVMTSGTMLLAAGLHEPVLIPLVIAYGCALTCASIRYAKQFADQILTRVQLHEKIELLGLLREFGSSGSDWLWELDSELRLTYVSSGFAHAMGVMVGNVVGKDVRRLLDPSGDVATGSTGMKVLFQHFADESPFADLAIPYRGRWCAVSGKPLLREGRCIGWRGVGSDITDVRLKGDDSTRAARRDPMTGLSNRLLLREELEQALLPEVGAQCALMLIDLDRFKLVNDTLGHSVGDELLKLAAGRLERTVETMALVGRMGGDEFAIVWRSPVDRYTLAEFARLVIARLSEAFVINDVEVRIGATVGIAVAPVDGHNQEELTACADLALYRAKETQRGSVRFYEAWMGEMARENRKLESEFRQALETNDLSIAYQPIVRAFDREVVGYEALLRWCHPERGDIPPSLFLPIIEESGLITRVGNWVIEQACADAATWKDPVPVAVNLSSAQLTGSWVASTVASALSKSGLEPARLEIEVTESIFVGDDALALAALADIRALGVKLVLDDFGKGYSAFGYLSRAQFSKVKIDREFVHGAAADEREHLAIVEAILALSRRLGIETTAEGIETPRQEHMMRTLGCDQMQGFRFGRPVPGEAIRRIGVESIRQYG